MRRERRAVLRNSACRWAARAGLLWLCASCNEPKAATHGGPAQQLGSTHPDVVSRVNGSSITISEVDSLARVGQFSAQAALHRLQAERLLAQEAESRGYARLSETHKVAQQALVQALLARDVESQQPSAAALDSAYAEQRARFEQPEQRRSTHVLAGLKPDAGLEKEQAAKAFIEQAIGLLRSASDLKATLASIKSESSPSFRVIVEELPLARAEGMFVPEFSQALFSLAETGVVPTPVRTQFGYHAIVVTEIVPPSATPKLEALDVLRGELGTRLHEKQVGTLVDSLRQRTRVAYAPQVEQLLGTLELRAD